MGLLRLPLIVIPLVYFSIGVAAIAQPQQSEQQTNENGAERVEPSTSDADSPREPRDRPELPFARGPGGGGFGPPGFRAERNLVAKFDGDHNGWLTAEERAAARKEMAAEGDRGGGPGFGRRGRGGPRFRGPGFGRQEREPPTPGERISLADVANYAEADLYDPTVLRTLFLEFESDDWEQELSDFHNTDVEVPVKLVVDGKQYADVGVHFRGSSSYMTVPAGYKRSLNLSLDFVNKDQRLYGYRTLNLLNSHDDDSLMSTVLYSHIARQYLAVPKANFVRVVINGENWGVYPNVQQFNKEFLKENFRTDAGSRWKVSGNPGADGGLRYLGEDIEPYRQRFTIKSKDDVRAWRDLVALCRTLEQSLPDELEAALAPMLDINGTLRFLALDVALVNNDGYWVRSSDYSLYQDPSGRFHLIPSDMNEAFRAGGGPRGGPGMRGGSGRRGRRGPVDRGPDEADNRDVGRNENESGNAGTSRGDDAEPGIDRERGNAVEQAEDERREADPRPDGPGFGPPDFGPPNLGRAGRDARGFGPPGFGPPGIGPPGFGGPRGGGVELDPLVGLESDRTPLRSKLLAVPALRARYLQYVREIAEESLDWNNLGPVVAAYRELIHNDVQRDTRKLSTFDEFLSATDNHRTESSSDRPGTSLRTFADKRRAYLLKKTDEDNETKAPSSGRGEANGPNVVVPRSERP